MKSVDKCSQYHPYAGKTNTCNGSFYKLSLLLSDGFTLIPNIVVCDNHLQPFIEFGQQNSSYKYKLLRKEFLDETKSLLETEQPSKKELR